MSTTNALTKLVDKWYSNEDSLDFNLSRSETMAYIEILLNQSILKPSLRLLGTLQVLHFISPYSNDPRESFTLPTVPLNNNNPGTDQQNINQKISNFQQTMAIAMEQKRIINTCSTLLSRLKRLQISITGLSIPLPRVYTSELLLSYEHNDLHGGSNFDQGFNLGSGNGTSIGGTNLNYSNFSPNSITSRTNRSSSGSDDRSNPQSSSSLGGASTASAAAAAAATTASDYDSYFGDSDGSEIRPISVNDPGVKETLVYRYNTQKLFNIDLKLFQQDQLNIFTTIGAWLSAIETEEKQHLTFLDQTKEQIKIYLQFLVTVASCRSMIEDILKNDFNYYINTAKNQLYGWNSQYSDKNEIFIGQNGNNGLNRGQIHNPSSSSSSSSQTSHQTRNPIQMIKNWRNSRRGYGSISSNSDQGDDYGNDDDNDDGINTDLYNNDNDQTNGQEFLPIDQNQRNNSSGSSSSSHNNGGAADGLDIESMLYQYDENIESSMSLQSNSRGGGGGGGSGGGDWSYGDDGSDGSDGSVSGGSSSRKNMLLLFGCCNSGARQIIQTTIYRLSRGNVHIIWNDYTQDQQKSIFTNLAQNYLLNFNNHDQNIDINRIKQQDVIKKYLNMALEGYLSPEILQYLPHSTQINPTLPKTDQSRQSDTSDTIDTSLSQGISTFTLIFPFSQQLYTKILKVCSIYRATLFKMPQLHHHHHHQQQQQYQQQGQQRHGGILGSLTQNRSNFRLFSGGHNTHNHHNNQGLNHQSGGDIINPQVQNYLNIIQKYDNLIKRTQISLYRLIMARITTFQALYQLYLDCCAYKYNSIGTILFPKLPLQNKIDDFEDFLSQNDGSNSNDSSSSSSSIDGQNGDNYTRSGGFTTHTTSTTTTTAAPTTPFTPAQRSGDFSHLLQISTCISLVTEELSILKAEQYLIPFNTTTAATNLLSPHGTMFQGNSASSRTVNSGYGDYTGGGGRSTGSNSTNFNIFDDNTQFMTNTTNNSNQINTNDNNNNTYLNRQSDMFILRGFISAKNIKFLSEQFLHFDDDCNDGFHVRPIINFIHIYSRYWITLPQNEKEYLISSGRIGIHWQQKYENLTHVLSSSNPSSNPSNPSQITIPGMANTTTSSSSSSSSSRQTSSSLSSLSSSSLASLTIQSDYGSDNDGIQNNMFSLPLEPPTLFPSLPLFLPAQELVNTYSIPLYKELNPANIVIGTFPFIFAVMFGDIIHGIMLFIIAITMYFTIYSSPLDPVIPKQSSFGHNLYSKILKNNNESSSSYQNSSSSSSSSKYPIKKLPYDDNNTLLQHNIELYSDSANGGDSNGNGDAGTTEEKSNIPQQYKISSSSGTGGGSGSGPRITILTSYYNILYSNILQLSIYKTINMKKGLILWFILIAFMSTYIGFIYNDAGSNTTFIFSSYLYTQHNLPNGINYNNYNVYPFGIDPGWIHTKQELTFLNSFKMKMAIILGIIHLYSGIISSIFNHLYFKKYINILLSTLPQLLLLTCTFGYMSILIILKWCTNYYYYSQKYNNNEIDILWSPVSIIQTMINMFLSPGVPIPQEMLMFSSQSTVQTICAVISILSVPFLFIAEPLHTFIQHKRWVKDNYGDGSDSDDNDSNNNDDKNYSNRYSEDDIGSTDEIESRRFLTNSATTTTTTTIGNTMAGNNNTTSPTATTNIKSPKSKSPLTGQIMVQNRSNTSNTVQNTPSYSTFGSNDVGNHGSNHDDDDSTDNDNGIDSIQLPAPSIINQQYANSPTKMIDNLNSNNNNNNNNNSKQSIKKQKAILISSSEHITEDDQLNPFNQHYNISTHFVHHGIHSIEFVLGIVSNTASYLRLWALSLAHAQLSNVFWSQLITNLGLAPGSNPIVLCIAVMVWFLSTVGVLLLMDAMECILHAVRLVWVEFQSKFYSGGGYLFQPFSLYPSLDGGAGVGGQ